MTEIDKINLKNYIGKKVIVFHRNLKKVVNYITYDSQYHDYPYGFNYRRYTKDGKILIDNENGWDILKIFMIQINKDKMTEIEKTKKEIEVLTEKLSFLEELEKTKSPVEEAFKRVYGYYPNTEVDDYGRPYNMDWRPFTIGYNAAQEDYRVGEYQESEKEPEELMEKLGFVKNSDGNWTAQPLVETAQEPIPEEEDHKTLYDILRELDKPMLIDDVCSAVKKWIFQYDCDYATCKEYLEGYEECQTVLEERLK